MSVPLRSKPSSGPGLPVLFPAICLHKGAIGFPRPEEPDRIEPLLDRQGGAVDIFDAADLLLGRYHRLYVVDIDGVRHRQPQFEYLQEISQGKEMWVDTGPRNVDEVMDVIVAGATRAVISTRTLHSAREISRALKVTSQVALELAVEGARTVAHDRELNGSSPVDVAEQARERGVADIIVASQGPGLQVELAQEISRGGPTYLGTPFREDESPTLQALGIAGGIFWAKEVLVRWTTSGS